MKLRKPITFSLTTSCTFYVILWKNITRLLTVEFTSLCKKWLLQSYILCGMTRSIIGKAGPLTDHKQEERGWKGVHPPRRDEPLPPRMTTHFTQIPAVHSEKTKRDWIVTATCFISKALQYCISNVILYGFGTVLI